MDTHRQRDASFWNMHQEGRGGILNIGYGGPKGMKENSGEGPLSKVERHSGVPESFEWSMDQIALK